MDTIAEITTSKRSAMHYVTSHGSGCHELVRLTKHGLLHDKNKPCTDEADSEADSLQLNDQYVLQPGGDRENRHNEDG